MPSTLGAPLQVTRYTDCYRQIEHILGGQLSGLITPKDLVDEAGHHLCNLHPWKWLEQRTTQLTLRPKQVFTSATWTESTLTLSAITPAFTAAYTAGDTVEITAGTGATPKVYETDSTANQTTTTRILQESIGSGATTGIAGFIANNLVELPSGLRDARTISATDAIVNGMTWTTPEDLQLKRTSQVDVSSSWNYFGYITYVGSPPRPALEIWPTTSVSDPRAFSLVYRIGWCPGSNDTDILQIPPHMRSCLYRLCRLFAMGYEEGDESGKKSIDVLLAEFELSPLLTQAKERDGVIQPTMGLLRGGAVQSMPHGYRKLLSSNVDAPT